MSVSCSGVVGEVTQHRYSIEQVLPHAHPMILLDEILDRDGEDLTAAVTIRSDSHFLQSDGVPSYIGIEYMAQAIAAYGGYEALEANRPVRIGFLLGTRKFEAKVPFFRIGDRLVVKVSAIYKEALSSFSCHISVDDTIVAEANLSVYQPTEPADQSLIEI